MSDPLTTLHDATERIQNGSYALEKLAVVFGETGNELMYRSSQER